MLDKKTKQARHMQVVYGGKNDFGKNKYSKDRKTGLKVNHRDILDISCFGLLWHYYPIFKESRIF